MCKNDTLLSVQLNMKTIFSKNYILKLRARAGTGLGVPNLSPKPVGLLNFTFKTYFYANS